MKVEKGASAILKWDTTPYQNAGAFIIYLNKQKNLVTVTSSGGVTPTEDAKDLYGDRLKIEKDGNLIRLTLSDVTHSDEGKFLAVAENNANDRPEIEEITLDVTGTFYFDKIFDFVSFFSCFFFI